MKAEATSNCQACGARVPVGLDYCPVCAFRGVLSDRRKTTEIDVELTDASPASRFDHYQLLIREDGTLFELGHGAMGVTYKAIDINLRCAVALKVIKARFIGDESARRRFVREARAAASVRHPNVASVFHLGQSGDGYFYAMEFVEGETLENLIKRAGQLELKLSLEIASQAAAGLAAVHKAKLVHRDIKPSNIMVSLDEGGSVTVKIIDLGLAKSLDEQSSQTAISMPGGFAGTPEFASPEQFAGVGVDIRSDLYSLGVVIWEMLTGKVPFNGSVNEVMYQHLHRPVPLELLKDISHPLIDLLKKLLEKDPTQRFQTPNELLDAMSGLTRSVKAGRPIKHQEARIPFVKRASSKQEKSPVIRTPKRTIAVLPFDNLSEEKGDTYFADGVQDEILSNLAKLSQLKVISRTSVMTYRPRADRDLRSIGRILRVANIIAGTVRKDGNRTRITVRLVDARTDVTIWSETYDHDLSNIFTIQSEIAQMVASKLAATISPLEKKRIEAKPTHNLEAYDRYVRAKQLIAYSAVTVMFGYYENHLIDAIALLEEAIRLDPKLRWRTARARKRTPPFVFDTIVLQHVAP
ncbi:MAG TPA: serine/threonine-protein kinase, partial [Chthoniobacterales bacterium]|nr:serine/threonine-protein kinase [Chthoniobacterales bacterium]